MSSRSILTDIEVAETPGARHDNAGATIYIAICAYRDPELRATIADCIERASHAERLYFGICNQFDSDTCISESEFANTRIISVPYSKSRGLVWARSQAQGLYDNQNFVL